MYVTVRIDHGKWLEKSRIPKKALEMTMVGTISLGRPAKDEKIKDEVRIDVERREWVWNKALMEEIWNNINQLKKFYTQTTHNFGTSNDDDDDIYIYHHLY